MDAANPSRFRRFVSELRRRHVTRVAVGYAASAYVVLQVAEIVAEAFGMEHDWLRILIVLAALLFPVVLTFAWVYELTPAGVRAMRQVDSETGFQEHDVGPVPRIALLLVTVLVVGTTGFWYFAGRASFAGATDGPDPLLGGAEVLDESLPIRSLGVLPLEDLTDNRENGYLATGMHEALVSRLSQMGSVRVLSRTTTAQYDPKGKSMPEVGRELGVEAIVEGSVFRSETRVRITAQLVRAASDSALWAGDFERDLGDVIALEDEVAGAIAQAVMSRLEQFSDDSIVEQRAGASHRTDPAAATAALRGRMVLADSGPGEATRHFQDALRADSTHAPALAGLAGARLIQGLSDSSMTPALIEEVRDLAERALAADPASAEAADVLGELARIDTATTGGLSVVSSRPRTRIAGPDLGWIPSKTELGKDIQAAAAARDATGPSAPAVRTEAASHLLAIGRGDQALAILRDVLDKTPTFAIAWDELEEILAQRGEWRELVSLRRKREAVLPPPTGAPSLADLERSVTAGTIGYWGWKLGELEARQRAGESTSPVLLAAAHAALGHSDEALDLLRLAASQQDPRLALLRADPVWDLLRPDPRFRQLYQEVFQVRVIRSDSAGASGPRPR